MNVLLMGPRCCGKTTIGRLLARRLGCGFVDLDDVTRSSFDELDAHAIWAAHGEAGWRRAEVESLRAVMGASDQVIALGGGTPMIDAARTILEHARADGEAWIVYLQCSVEELERRLRNEPGDRPSLTGDDPVAEIGAVLAAREPTYRALADLELPVSAGTIDEAVASIETTLAKRSRGGMGAE